MQNGLIDQYRIWVYPLVLGSGKRLFKDGIKRADLSLVDTKPLSSGVVILIYQPGDNRGCAMGVAEPEVAELSRTDNH